MYLVQPCVQFGAGNLIEPKLQVHWLNVAWLAKS